MSDLAVVLAICFAASLIVCLVIRVHTFKRVSLFDWTLIGMAGVYGIGWAIVLLVTDAGENPLWESWIPVNASSVLWHTPLAAILAFSIYLGWLLPGKFHSRCLPPTARSLQIKLSSMRVVSRLKISAWVMLLCALAAQWLYADAYGGFLGALDYSARIRSAIFEINNRWSFLQPFTGLALIASFVFFGLSLTRRDRSWLGLMLSTLFSIYLLFSWLGRIGFLIYVASFYLGILLFRKSNHLGILFKSTISLFAILVGAYYISAALNLKFTEGFFKYLATELSFPFGSFFGHFLSSETVYRWFVDIAIAPVYLLPTSIWNAWIENISAVNTTLIMKAPKGVAGVTGGIPVDLLTFGFLQASGFGIIAVGIFFGFFLRVLEVLLNKVPHQGVQAVLQAYVALKIAVLGIYYSQPELIVKGNFALLIAAIIITIFILMPQFRIVGRGH